MEHQEAIFKRATKLGHKPSEPVRARLSKTSSGYVIGCDNCLALATITSDYAHIRGDLLTSICHPTAQTAPLVRNKQAAKSKPNKTNKTNKQPQKRQAVPRLTPIAPSAPSDNTREQAPLAPHAPNINLPAFLPVCPYCASGTTLVGRSCKHCQQSSQLTERQQFKTGAVQYRRNDATPIMAQRIFVDNRWYQLASYDVGEFTAPCGTSTKFQAVYYPAGVKVSPAQAAPLAILVYDCKHRCRVDEAID